MFRKALAVGLALLVLWAGFAHEPAFSSLTAEVSGSAAHHLFDHPPVQPTAETVGDGSCLVATGAGSPGLAPRAARPAEAVEWERASPCLAGPLRPPRALRA